AHMFVIAHDGAILLEQRPPSGIWGGLLSLPERAKESATDELKLDIDAVIASHGEAAAVTQLTGFTHVFTHFRLHVTPHRIDLRTRRLGVAQSEQVWYPMAELAGAPLPAPVKKMLLAL